jgi:hypothetical protein
MLYGLIHDRNKDMAQAFDRYSQSRSSALWGLRLYVMHDLLTDAELSVLSEDALAYISGECQIFCVRAGNGLPYGKPSFTSSTW